MNSPADAGGMEADASSACASPRYRPNETYQAGDRVRSGGRVYACSPPATLLGCQSCSVEAPATGEAWSDLGPCLESGPEVPSGRAEVDGYFAAPASFLLPAGSFAPARWRYTTAPPSADWTSPTFDASSWPEGESGFFHGAGQERDGRRTPWPEGASDLWLRTTFALTDCDIPQLMLWARWDDGMTVFVNGVEAAHEEAATGEYRYLGFSAAARDALRVGSNVIAVRATGADEKYFDLGLTRLGPLTTRPTSGFERTPGLSRFGDTVRRFMIAHGIPAGVLAVTRGESLVVGRGFGWADKAFTRPLRHDAVLRLASVDKVFTLAAVRTLVDSGEVDSVTGAPITLDTKLFPLLRAHGLAPAPRAVTDPASDLVTVGQLVAHSGGLQELPSPEQLYADLERTASTASAVDNVRWVYSQPLLFYPGSETRYSSSGYMVLRHLITTVSGDLLSYLRDVVLTPVGTRDVFIAHERLSGRSPREPWYATFVEPYDRFIYLENYTALASSAEAVVRLLRGYHLALGTRLVDPTTGAWAAVPDNGGNVFFGAYEGTWSMALQRRWDEVNVAVILNIAGHYDALHEQLAAVADTMPEAVWTEAVR